MCACITDFFLFPNQIYAYSFFFFNDTATTEIYTLSLHDALPIFRPLAHTGKQNYIAPHSHSSFDQSSSHVALPPGWSAIRPQDRKSTRLNSSHQIISYAVFCLKKKKMSR